MEFISEVYRSTTDQIVEHFLYSVSITHCNPFEFIKRKDCRQRFYQSRGFECVDTQNQNQVIVEEELLLESFARALLINPLFEQLFIAFGIPHEWHYGTPFDSERYYPNALYEKDAIFEFIFQREGRNIGCRYDHSSMPHDAIFNCLLYKQPVPGYKSFTQIDEMWRIDWSGISNDVLDGLHPCIPGHQCLQIDISLKAFFQEVFNENAYEWFYDTVDRAMVQARNMLARKSVSQLLPQNILDFRMQVLSQLQAKNVWELSYQYSEKTPEPKQKCLPKEDAEIIQKILFTEEFCRAIIGKADFAKSYITSEYLFQTTSDGLEIDYTSVVVGYLKSVEQLLFLAYECSFHGNSEAMMWDSKPNYERYLKSLSKKNRFLCSEASEKEDFLHEDKKDWKLCRYIHSKESGEKTPMIRRLIELLGSNEEFWRVSTDGIKHIYSCLDDYRDYCRNSHFHKDNIWCSDYDTVKRIRNNTQICLCYLLGSLNVFDFGERDSSLGIVDYSFDILHQMVCQKNRKLLYMRFQNGYQGLAYHLDLFVSGKRDKDNLLVGIELKFLKVNLKREGITYQDIKALVNDDQYVKRNSFIVTRDNMPIDFYPYIST